MEYMPNGDFADLLQRESRLYEDEAKIYLAEVVLALEALHNYGIIHRDIKPQNIVIDKNGHIKITDYGLSEAGLVKRKQDEQKNKTLSKFILKEMKKKKVEIESE
jgi:serine/threonine protein kinase